MEFRKGTMACTFLFLTSFIISFASIRPEVVLKNNGYEGVVVAVHSSIKEDLAILSNLKSLFRLASKFLFHATEQRAFFRYVTIALPAHWSDQDDYITSTGNHFPGAHIRVDAPNPEYGNEPYTLQPGGCGEPGRYIHLTTDFVLSLKKKASDEKQGKRLVHEWAHLRYGVFDENGYPNDPKYPVFYRDGRQIFTNACVRNIRGSMVKLEDDGPCDITEGNDIELTNCTFIPFDDNEVKASLMFKPYVPSIMKFCDEYSHNTVAPNKHNEMCNSESVWTIVKRHADFKSNPPTTLLEEELETEFRVVKAKQDDRGRYVLVLDVSGSMVGKPIQLLHNAASRLISDVVKEGSFMGLVSFQEIPFTLSPLVQITNQTRMELVSKLPRDTGGKTAIGQGLLRGAEVLSETDNITDGAVIVLLTDGEENVAPFIKMVIPHIQKKKIIVHCIAFGSAASGKLENLARVTGGKSFLVQDVSGNKPIMVLDSAFRESVLTTMEEEEQPVLVVQDDLNLYNPQTELGIDLDPQLGLNTVFSLDVTGLDTNSVNMTVVSPGGKIYGPGSGSEIYSADRDHIKVTIQNETEPGSYNVHLTKRDGQNVKASIAVTSEPRDPGDPPIRVTSWLSDIQVNYPGRIRVFAEVKRGYDPVIGAYVTATVRQDTSLQEVVLHDNGVGPDVTKDDGIYSAFITQFDGNGRYGVVSKVTTIGDARMKFSSKASSRKVRSVIDHKDMDGIKTAASNTFLPPFQRTAEAGTFLVHNWTRDVLNIYPPEKVRDLEVIDKKVISGDYKVVTLSWIFPDETIDETRVILVDLRASCNREDIVKNFTQAFAFNDSLVVNGSLKVSPHERQIMTVKIPSDLTKDPNCTSESVESYYFALRLYENTAVSDTSVITAAHFINIPTYKEAKTDNLTYWFIGGSICTILILLIIIIIIMRKVKKVTPKDMQWK